MKKILTIALLLFLVGCTAQEDTDMEMQTPETTPETETETPETEQPVENEEPMEMMYLTLTELAMYDGTQMEMMYVAVDGIIYDLTGIEAWASGTHNGVKAGTDGSDMIGLSPHKEAVLEDLPVVGMLVEEFTLETLAMYDGVQMEMMYIAVDGLVYDVTEIESWASGTHNGVAAGTDGSDMIGLSPHKEAVLEELTVVGKLK